MKYIEYAYFIFIVLFLVISWQVIDKIVFKENIYPLEDILQSAKNNRKELEKVLCHYRSNSTDSLKYKAACFLIENMPFYVYTVGEQLENYKSYYTWLKKSRGKTPDKIK